jgi:hydrogenase maturation protease
MSSEIVVIGIGNDFRRDDGVGWAVAAGIGDRTLPGVRAMTAVGEPAAILEAWADVSLAIVVDAALGDGTAPGTIRRWTLDDDDWPAVLSSHAMGLPQTYALGAAVGQVPEKLVVFTVDIADADHGVGLSPLVAAAVPGVIDLILAEIQHCA